jgi:hypothetical protein
MQSQAWCPRCRSSQGPVRAMNATAVRDAERHTERTRHTTWTTNADGGIISWISWEYVLAQQSQLGDELGD